MLLRRFLTRLLALLPEDLPASTTVSDTKEPDEPSPGAPASEKPTPVPEKTPPCKGTAISDRAASMIISRTLAHDPDEVSGILLGQLKDGICYVVEATDAGPKAFHSPDHVEMNVDYQNHVSAVVLELYHSDATLLGPWHRHPDSFDFFSPTDLSTIAAYAKNIGGWAVAMLVNMDPDMRLSCFFCELQEDGRLDIRRIPVLVGDRYFQNTGLLDTVYPACFPTPITNAPLCYPIP